MLLLSLGHGTAAPCPLGYPIEVGTQQRRRAGKHPVGRQPRFDPEVLQQRVRRTGDVERDRVPAWPVAALALGAQ